MIIRFHGATFKQTSWTQYALRFAAGGMITVAAGLIAHAFGPEWGGLFLAFPAIFPATVTLVAKHERERKAKSGVSGKQRGIDAAGVNSAGATIGSTGLLAFAITEWWLLHRNRPTLAMLAATLVWLFVVSISYLVWRRRRRHYRP